MWMILAVIPTLTQEPQKCNIVSFSRKQVMNEGSRQVNDDCSEIVAFTCQIEEVHSSVPIFNQMNPSPRDPNRPK